MPDASLTAPVAPHPTARYAALDVARGIAILGTLATNIWLFTDPEGMIGYLDGTSTAGTPAVWRGVEAVAQQLSQGKFLGLLTLMFGIGLELQRRSAVRRGRSWPGPYPIRAGLLFLDGVINYVLIAEFDVLMGYAVTGVIVAYLLATSERVQRVWLVVCAAVHLVVLSAMALLLGLVPAPPSAPLRPNPYADGSFADLVVFRLANPATFRFEPVFILALSIALFLLGSQLVRAGVLEPDGARLRRRLMLIAVPALVVDLVVGIAGGLPGLFLARYATAPVVSLGLLAAVVCWVGRRPDPGFARRRLSEVGRTALSCYLAQNLIASFLCYGWGLGIAAATPAAWRVPVTLALWVVVSAVVVGGAAVWCRRFERGPVELAWHRSARALTPARLR